MFDTKKIIEKLPQQVKDDLFLECGGLCTVPRCSDELWDFYPLDNDIDNLVPENLLGLCHTHFPMAGRSLNNYMLRTIKTLLDKDRFPHKDSSIRYLTSREDYLSEVIRHLWTTGDELFIQYVGPLCLHPEWYHARRDSIYKLPNMDRTIQEFIIAHSRSRTSKIKVIFRNAPRYLDKVNEVVRPDERGQFISDVISKIDRIWGQNCDRGPDMCCLETGFLHIPTIFKNVAITSSRTSSNVAIQEGTLYLDPDVVEVEKKRFAKIFDTNFRGLKAEIDTLKEFVTNLWKN